VLKPAGAPACLNETSWFACVSVSLMALAGERQRVAAAGFAAEHQEVCSNRWRGRASRGGAPEPQQRPVCGAAGLVTHADAAGDGCRPSWPAVDRRDKAHSCW